MKESLYACDPVFEICKKNKWEFLIRYQDGSIPLWQKNIVQFTVDIIYPHYQYSLLVGSDNFNWREVKDGNYAGILLIATRSDLE